MIMNRRSLAIYATLALLWVLMLGWLGAEHYRIIESGRAALVNRAKDISSTAGIVLRGQRHFGGVVSKERLEPALAELVKPGQLNGIAPAQRRRPGRRLHRRPHRTALRRGLGRPLHPADQPRRPGRQRHPRAGRSPPSFFRDRSSPGPTPTGPRPRPTAPPARLAARSSAPRTATAPTALRAPPPTPAPTASAVPAAAPGSRAPSG